MLKIGIVGLGFMGKTHFDIFQKMNGKARVCAIAEPDPEKRKGNLSGVAGNIGQSSGNLNMDGISAYASLDEMLAKGDIDVVDITLPTFLHREAALKSFAAGKHVICEKPLALDYPEAMEIVSAGEKAGRRLFVGQCIRFWPAYVKAYELIRSNTLGKTLTANFLRLSATPGWIWQNWSHDQNKSGGAPLDLHIHDADFISYLYGRPQSVTAFAGGRNGLAGAIDHITASYHYGDERLITATGAWEYSTGYPFSMTFSIHLEKGTLALAADGNLSLYTDRQESQAIAIEAGDGWIHELNHFVDCIASGKQSEILTPEDAAFSVKLVRAEIESARRRCEVTIR